MLLEKPYNNIIFLDNCSPNSNVVFKNSGSLSSSGKYVVPCPRKTLWLVILHHHFLFPHVWKKCRSVTSDIFRWLRATSSAGIFGGIDADKLCNIIIFFEDLFFPHVWKNYERLPCHPLLFNRLPGLFHTCWKIADYHSAFFVSRASL